MRRRLPIPPLAAGGLLAVLAIGSLASCDAPKRTQPRPAARISFLHYFSGSLSGGIDQLVAAFNLANQDYRLSATPLDHESFKSSIVDTLKAENPPDIYSYWAGAKTLAILPFLEPIDDLWASASLDSVFPSALAASASVYEGRHYLLPLTQHFVGFFYNKSLFKRAGVEPPSDWKSFLAACAALKAAGILPIALGAQDKWPAQFWFDYLLLRTAGPDYRDRLMNGEASWTDPETLRAFGLWRELLGAGYFSASPNSVAWDTGAARMVAGGQAAMILMGTWIMGSWESMGLEWKEGRDYGFFRFPTIDPGAIDCALGPVDGIVIPKKAKNLAGAKLALAYMSGPGPQAAMSRGSGALAPSLAVPPATYTEIQRQVRAAIAASRRWAFNYDLATPPEASEIGLSLFAEFLQFPDQVAVLLKGTESRMAAALAARRGDAP